MLVLAADSPHFNPRLYYQSLIERSSLADLLRVQAELARGACPPPSLALAPQGSLPWCPPVLTGALVTCFWGRAEIRQLDQEKHDLIYGRHHDLVAASVTIQRVRPLAHPLSVRAPRPSAA